jgi:hypothetical protein
MPGAIPHLQLLCHHQSRMEAKILMVSCCCLCNVKLLI